MKIKAIITGATGMVGKGVLLECLDSPEVESVLSISRQSLEMEHPKLKEIIHKDFLDLSPIQDQLAGYNSCFFCLGVSSFRMSEETYTRLTYDLSLHFAQTVLAQNPDMTFCYVSGTGTDSSEKGNSMWARVKGKTENAIMALPFKASYMFRPGVIIPEKGVKSKTPLYNSLYVLMNPLFPLIKKAFPKYMTTSVKVGQAMINSILTGYEKRHLENADINILAEAR
jgi:hypothetical protein